MLALQHAARVGLSAAAVLAAGTAGGCKDAPPPSPPRSEAVSVLDPGEGPEWTPFPWRDDDAGETDAATRPLELRLALELGYAGEPIPGQRLTAVTDLRVRVTGPREARVSVAALDVRPEDPDPARAAVVREDFAAQSPVGLEGALRAGGGASPDVRLETPRGAAGAVRHYLDHLRLALGLLLVPWPDAGAREGARWSRTRDVEVARIALAESTTYTLLEADGDRATVAVDGRFVARTAALDFEGLPDDASCRLRSVDATVTGTVSLARGAPLPAAADLELELRLVADVTTEGETAPLDGRLTLRVALPE